MTTPSASFVYNTDEEHKRKINEISALVFEELSRIEGGTGSGTADLSKSIETLQDIVDQVKSDCTAGLRRRAQEHNAVALINRRLPTEILAEIVLYVVWSERDRYYAQLYDLRSVSKYWNNLIESTPSIWTVLDCTAMEHSGCSSPTNLMKSAIKRSGSLPIHVTAYAISSDDTPFELLLGVSSRWHDADMNLYSNMISDFISHGNFPNLVTLTLRELPGPHEMDEIGQCITPCGSFPALQRLQTDAILLRPTEGFVALQTLIVEPEFSSENTIIPCIALPTYLDCCSNLTELRIFNVWGYDEWRPEEAKGLDLRLPNLHTLTIWDCDLGFTASLLQALKVHSCKKLFVNLVDYEESHVFEWQRWQQECDVFQLLDRFVPLIQNSCKETNCVELVLGPEQFQFRTHTSASETAGAAQSVVIGLADVAKPQTAKALLDVLGLRDRASPFGVHLRVSMKSDPNEDQVLQFKEELLLPILEWPSVTSLSVDMDEPNAVVFLEELRKPLQSGPWPLPNVTTLSFDSMNVRELSADIGLLYKMRLAMGAEVARIRSLVITLQPEWPQSVLERLLGDLPTELLVERDPQAGRSWKNSLP